MKEAAFCYCGHLDTQHTEWDNENTGEREIRCKVRKCQCSGWQYDFEGSHGRYVEEQERRYQAWKERDI